MITSILAVHSQRRCFTERARERACEKDRERERERERASERARESELESQRESEIESASKRESERERERERERECERVALHDPVALHPLSLCRWTRCIDKWSASGSCAPSASLALSRSFFYYSQALS